MSKCKLILARSDEYHHTFVCITGHDDHSIYKYGGTSRFHGVVRVSRQLWKTRIRFGQMGKRI